MLSVVHDQQGLPSAGVRFQVSGEGVAERLARSALRVPHAELLADGGQQLLGAEDGIEDQRHVDVLGEPVEEYATHGRLAVAALAGEMHHAMLVPDAAEQMRERPLVLRAQIDESRIGRVREGALAETEMVEVRREHPRGCRRGQVVPARQHAPQGSSA